jgi:Ca2+-binding EF-hand superfamily protein
MQRRRDFRAHQVLLKEKQTRRWLTNKGKNYLLDFSDDELKKLRECFDSLDDDLSGSIGIDELENPLIGLGFADTREEI